MKEPTDQELIAIENEISENSEKQPTTEEQSQRYRTFLAGVRTSRARFERRNAVQRQPVKRSFKYWELFYTPQYKPCNRVEWSYQARYMFY